MAYLVFLFLTVYGLALISCVQGWTYNYSPYNMTYDDAYKYCTEKYTSMVAIQNLIENEHLNNILPRNEAYYWIGIRKNKSTGKWTWVGTNKVLTKEAENWAKGEPNNLSNNKDEDCVEMYVKRPNDTGKWNDDPCSKKKVALCYTASCHSSSCNNHGECIENINNHTCNCYDGFYGEECEHVVTCPEINGTDHGSMTCSHVNGNFTYLSNCHFNCSDGYVLVGSENLSCTKDGDWGAHVPHCKEIQCKRPEVPLNGVIRCSNDSEILTDKSMCNFSCNDGFSLVGSTSVICMTPGQWTEEPPKCNAIQCKRPEEPENGVMDCSDNKEMLPYKSSCNFKCKEGFNLVGSPSTKCMSPYQWTEEPPRCEAIQCQHPEIPRNGTMQCSSNEEILHYNSSCIFTCNEGYTLVGSLKTKCIAPDHWTNEPPKCEVVQCSSLLAPTNGQVECQNGSKYNSKCTFSCAEGFKMVGSSDLQCQISGNWTSSVPTCQAVQCAPLVAPDNGEIKCQESSSYKSQCLFTCQQGFKLIGSSDLSCLSSGKWTSAAPKCEALKCEALTVPLMGKMNCTHLSGEFEYGSVCTFDCGYDLSLNGSSTIECDSSGRWSTEPPTCEVVKRPIISPTYITVGAVSASASLMSVAGLLLWLAKRFRKTAKKFTPSNYQHLEAAGVYQNTNDSNGIA
ncbi:E-selectin-like isoform X2 [Lithobates pipiens]